MTAYYPTSDVATTNWTPSAGATLWGVVDDTDDADYCSSSAGVTTAATVALSIPAQGVAPSAANVVVRAWSMNGGSSAEKMTIDVLEGATVRHTGTATNLNRGSAAAITETLSGAEIAAITDWTQVRVRFAATTIGAAEYARVSSVQFNLTPGAQTVSPTAVASTVSIATPTLVVGSPPAQTVSPTAIASSVSINAPTLTLGGWSYRAGTYADDGGGFGGAGAVTNGETRTLTLGGAVSVGDRIVLHVITGCSVTTTPPTFSVQDDLNSGTYHEDATHTWIDGGGNIGTRQSVYSKIATAGGTPTITVTFTIASGTAFGGLQGLAFAGLLAADAGVDVTAPGQGTGSPSTSASSATGAANELVLGAYADLGYNTTLGADTGAGFALIGKHDADGVNWQGLLETKDSGSLGATPAASATTTGTPVWGMLEVVYKNAGTASQSVSPTSIASSATIYTPNLGGLPFHYYQTNFDLTENPISEGGVWTLGATDGLDWSDWRSGSGQAWGTETPQANNYSDGITVLRGTFGADQRVSGVLFNNISGDYWPEIELLLRFAITAHNARGYEIDIGLAGDQGGGWLSIVRWNGTKGDFTTLASLASFSGVTGDEFTGEAIGDWIGVYKNGALVLSATDSTWTDGNPGAGHDVADYGTVSHWGLTSLVAATITLVSPSSIASTLNIPTPTLAPGAVSVSPTAIASTLAISTPVLASSISVATAAIASSSSIAAPTLAPGAASIAPTAIAASSSVNAPTFAAGAVSVSPTAISSSSSIATPTLVAGGISVSPTAISSSSAVTTPTLAPGAVSVSPTAIASTLAISAPVLASSISVATTAIAASSSVTTPTFAAGAAPLATTAIASTVSINTPTLSGGAAVLTPTAIASSVSFSVPTFAPGGVTGASSAISSSVSINAPAFGVTVAPTAISSSVSINAPAFATGGASIATVSIGSTLTIATPALLLVGGAVQEVATTAIASSVSIAVPTFAPGGVSVASSAISSTLNIPTPTLASSIAIATTSIGSTLSIGTPTLEGGAAVLTPTAISSGLVIAVPTFGPGGVDVATSAISSTLSIAPARLALIIGRNLDWTFGNASGKWARGATSRKWRFGAASH